jgi:uncharacterized membrane protein
MTSRKLRLDNIVGRALQMPQRSPKSSSRKRKSHSESTFSQRLADAMADSVGSWGFILAQSAVLVVWIILNVLPGASHWDPAPFILLNLVFSFASAYTAPVVLMSQNRQAELDRQNAGFDHQVNLKAGRDIECLHEKMDNLWEQQLLELAQTVKQQQQSLDEIKASLVPARNVQTKGKFSNDV